MRQCILTSLSLTEEEYINFTLQLWKNGSINEMCGVGEEKRYDLSST